MDAGRQAWLWRDWLIEALRSDKPFDEFVVEQIAGDLLPDSTPAQRVATGFLRNHVTTDEGGAINEEYLVEYAAERTNTVGSVFLGLTVGCARCHDHKYDPFRQEDYYRLFSFFNNNQEPGLYNQSKNANRALEPNLSVPTVDQQQRRSDLRQQIAAHETAVARTTPAEQHAFRALIAELTREHQLAWSRPTVRRAESSGGATLTIGVDGSVVAGGESPAKDVHVLTMHSDRVGQRWLCLEALTDDSLPDGRVGRASHGNVVLQHLQLEVRPAGSTAAWQPVPFRYAIADVEQQNGDFIVGNVLDDDDRGWAPAGHQAQGSRSALLLADREFGYPGGTELRVTLRYDSRYGQHVFGRVRFATSATSDAALARLPVATSGKYVAGPFVPGEGEPNSKPALYEREFGPDSVRSVDGAARFGKHAWRFDAKWAGAGPHRLAQGRNVHYVAQRVWLPDARKWQLALGSDDGFELFVDGKQVAERRVDRPCAGDQDRATLVLAPGPHVVVLKIVNTGGASAFALDHVTRDGELPHDLCLALLPDFFGNRRLLDRVTAAYRSHYSPAHRARLAKLASLRSDLDKVEAGIPQAMVMRERAKPRPTFVLMRGEYDKADKSRKVTRELPAMFGELPADLPRNRLGLARWLVSEQNPLLHRVAVNRLWEFVFGTGIVRTSEDFGLQGEWPSHKELLDWLAMEFRARGHSTRAMLRLMVTSRAFQRQSKVAASRAVDPGNRLLSWFPRRRLTAETIRDQSLYVAGLLVERPGGPSVKPYQPEGLWREVAMLQSNTRIFERGQGDALWRRSLYTYWKRACPPPALSIFDAPTREFCTIRRSTTNTPLQALVLWNDEQFVEAARLLAHRSVHAHATDRDRVQAMYRRTTGRLLDARGAELAMATLRELRQRYRDEPAAAEALLAVGTAHPASRVAAPELAAFAMLASAFLDLDASIYLD